MTKNVYKDAIVTLSNAKEYNASNKKKIQSLILLSNDKRVHDALKANNVDATRFNARALYATEKCVKIVHSATRDVVSAQDVNDNALAAIKCALLAQDADAHMLKSDIECALLADHNVSSDRAHLVYQRKAKISAAAQVQQCVDMLKTLNIVKEVARNTFAVQQSALLDTMREKFADIAV